MHVHCSLLYAMSPQESVHHWHIPQCAKCLARRMVLLRSLEALWLNKEYWFQLPKFLSAVRHSCIYMKHGWSVWNTMSLVLQCDQTGFQIEQTWKFLSGLIIPLSVDWQSLLCQIWFRNSLHYYLHIWPASNSIFPSPAVLLSYHTLVATSLSLLLYLCIFIFVLGFTN